MNKPIIAITMGDAAGIGPELVVKALSQAASYESCCPFVVGDPEVLSAIVQVVGAPVQVRAIESLSEASFSPPAVDVLRPEGLRIEEVPWGKVDPAMGKAAALCLAKAFELAMAGQVQGVVSAPLSKEAFHLAGYHYRDELAYLSDLTGSPGAFTMGVMDWLWTAAVTEHVPFRDIASLVKKEQVLRRIGDMHTALAKTGLVAPRVAVAALNPHGGEGGLLGREELDEIAPAIEEANQRDINARGPLPADTVFVRALAGEFDGVVCMYHDQANIARKLQPRGTGATIFMGLPVICATTAHGTAFDKAGQGIADPSSLQKAVEYVVVLARPASRPDPRTFPA
jgi:4-hydroxythreonine-4-phosphate dehydrogenase